MLRTVSFSTVLGYRRWAWLRLAASVPRVAIEIRWSPTIAAEPSLTGVTAQPDIRPTPGPARRPDP